MEFQKGDLACYSGGWPGRGKDKAQASALPFGQEVQTGRKEENLP